MQWYQKIDWWNIAFSVFFVFLLYVAFRLVTQSGVTASGISLGDTIIMALATFRLTRLMVYDSITKWVRNLFEDGKPMTFIGTAKTLVNCPWCMGLWFALIVTTVYFTAPILWFFMFVLALSAIASVMQISANAIGWSAEYKKQMVLRTRGDKPTAGTCG